MKATGIVRRIDDLGRVVIPKEIRKRANIQEGCPLEIYIDDFNGTPVICFMKYETDNNKMEDFLSEIINTLDTLGEYSLSVEASELKQKISKKFSEDY